MTVRKRHKWVAVHADLLVVDITTMLPRDERVVHGGVVGEGRSGISCLSNMQLSHPGEPAKSRQLHGR